MRNKQQDYLSLHRLSLLKSFQLKISWGVGPWFNFIFIIKIWNAPTWPLQMRFQCLQSNIPGYDKEKNLSFTTPSLEFPSNIWDQEGCQAVSYTHLDVYKRQVWHFHITIRWVGFMNRYNIYIKVSCFHNNTLLYVIAIYYQWIQRFVLSVFQQIIK